MTQVNVNPVEEASKEQMFTAGDYFWISSKDRVEDGIAILAQVEPNVLKLIMIVSGNRFTDATAPLYSDPKSREIGLSLKQMSQYFDEHDRYTFTPIKEVIINTKE